MRILALDIGRRRIGLAISDRTRTLARPLSVVTVNGATGVDILVQEIASLAAEEDGLAGIVVGLPQRLGGEPSEHATFVQQVIDQLRTRTPIPIVTEDERLTSREAESRLALRERDWRKRKNKIDAAAAAIILQDYLDRPRPIS